MTQNLLDPWNDAAAIAERMHMPAARLVLAIGAEAWCRNCRTFRPIFEALSQTKDEHDAIWVWLDLEVHAEFLDGLIPESLPLLLSYSGSHLTHAFVPGKVTQPAIAELLEQSSCIEHGSVPDVRARLMAVDWAT